MPRGLSTAAGGRRAQSAGILKVVGERKSREETPKGRAASFGARLRSLRRAASLTQEELALRAGLSPNAVSALERGTRRRPHPHTVRSLSDALGLPEVERAALLTAVPERDDAAFSAAEEEEEGVAPASPSVSALPHPATPLVGRERELEEVRGLLAQQGVRLVTLTGIGGVGKTRLAVEAASEAEALFPDGAAFVGLAPLADPSLVISAVSRSLGVPEAEGRSPREALVEYLRDKSLLIVLDNFEHLLQAAPEMAELIEACPKLIVLATSRAPLRIRGEREYPVPPLALPTSTRSPSEEEVLASPSGKLFVERAQAASPGFTLTRENASSVAAICWRLAGLPLALELAAAKARLLDPATLLSRLDRALSDAWARDLPERQRTMKATLDWSHDLLSEQERELFRRLSTFSGGFTLQAVEAVGSEPNAAEDGSGPEEVLELLGVLVEQSLVLAEVGGGGPTRYRMLEPVHQYALRRLEESGEAEGARRRHAAFYLALAEAAEPELKGADQVEWLGRLEREQGNLRATWNWLLERGDAEAAAQFGYSLYVFWWIRGYHTEGRRWMEATLSRETDLSPVGRAKALFVCGAMAMAQGDHSVAETCYTESDALFEAARDIYGGARPKLGLGLLAMSRADAQQATEYLRESAKAASEAEDSFWASLSLSALGMVSFGQGKYDEARTSLTEGLALAKRAGDRFSRYIALYNRSVLAQAQGDNDRAAALFEEGLMFSLEVGDYANIAYCMEGLAAVAVARDEADLATLLLGAAQRLCEGVGSAVYTYRPDRSLQERTMEIARVRLGEPKFEEAWTQGGAMSFEQAIEHALRASSATRGDSVS
ncbi:MAG: helix-turn-helix domain-containing protein [Actinomycetota bacterium]|nr:helix-turn-helix domain-containing protein [Actinomycetota bacterium]